MRPARREQCSETKKDFFCREGVCQCAIDKKAGLRRNKGTLNPSCLEMNGCESQIDCNQQYEECHGTTCLQTKGKPLKEWYWKVMGGGFILLSLAAVACMVVAGYGKKGDDLQAI